MSEFVTVLPGETLEQVASRSEVDLGELYDLNQGALEQAAQARGHNTHVVVHKDSVRGENVRDEDGNLVVTYAIFPGEVLVLPAKAEGQAEAVIPEEVAATRPGRKRKAAPVDGDGGL